MEFWNHRRESRRRTDQYALLLLISPTRLSQLIVLRRKFLTLNFVLLPLLPTDTCNPEPPPSLVIRNLHFVLLLLLLLLLLSCCGTLSLLAMVQNITYEQKHIYRMGLRGSVRSGSGLSPEGANFSRLLESVF